MESLQTMWSSRKQGAPTAPATTTKARGDAAEDAALLHLQRQGLRLVQRNFKTPGRGGGPTGAEPSNQPQPVKRANADTPSRPSQRPLPIVSWGRCIFITCCVRLKPGILRLSSGDREEI
eukprot:gene47614-63843_t